jgi:hypothetical protein
LECLTRWIQLPQVRKGRRRDPAIPIDARGLRMEKGKREMQRKMEEAVRSSDLREMQRKIVSTAASWFRGSGWRASSSSTARRYDKQARVCSAIGLRRARRQRALWSRDLRHRERHDAATEVRCWVRGSDASERQQQKGGAWLALARCTDSESAGDSDPWLR